MQNLCKCFLCFGRQLECEENCNLKVVGVTSDVASSNRIMYRMHLHVTKEEDINDDVDVVIVLLMFLLMKKDLSILLQMANTSHDCGLHLVPKITNEHIKLSPFSVMNVRLAAHALSESVYQVLHMYVPPEAAATSIY